MMLPIRSLTVWVAIQDVVATRKFSWCIRLAAFCASVVVVTAITFAVAVATHHDIVAITVRN